VEFLNEVLIDAIRHSVREKCKALLSQQIGVESTGAVSHHGPDAATPYLTVKEAAEYSRLATSTVRLYIRKKRLVAHRVGRRVIIKREDLESFLEAQAGLKGKNNAEA